MVKIERKKNATRNILWGAINRIITLVLPFVSRTIMIYTLGMDYVGLGSLFSSILQVLNFAELGIGSAIVFSMYKPMAEGNDDEVSALLNLYKKTYRIIGIVTLALGIIVLPFLRLLVAGDLPDDINIQVLFIFYFVNNLIGYFLFAYKQSLFIASQRTDIISKIGIGVNALSSILQIIVLLTIKNYYIYVLIIPIITLINNIIVGVLSDRVFPQYKCIGKIDDSERKEIEKKVRGMFYQKIGVIILSSSDTLVISSILGLRILGIYNGYYYVITTLFGFIAVIQSSSIPSIGNSLVNESIQKNLNDFKKFHFMYMWIIVWCCSCLLGLYQQFIKIWQGVDNMLADEMVFLLVIYFFAYKMGDISWMYREAMGLWWEARFVPLVSSMVNLVVNIIFVKMIGLPGVLISSIFSLAMINLPWASKVLFAKYFNSQKEWRLFLLRTLEYFIVMIIVSSLTYIICGLIPDSGIISLFVRLIICTLISNFLLVLINILNPQLKTSVDFIRTIR